MTRGQRIQALFEQAVELPQKEREHFLNSECADDETMREELRALIAIDENPNNTAWNQSALQTVAESTRGDADPRIGRRLGAYRIVELIARGGMGKVYRAERDDDAYRQSVAIKLIRYGLDSEETAARFRFERQILASLNHPNIARLLDGGTDEDSLPYLVMEFVEGEPVTQYCEKHSLTVRARLELFQKICTAVHYAHERMVIHRDLKPGNILVTADGTPKLLDFGIAKLAGPTDASPATVTGMRLLTPRYASPEQIAQETVTTASDVYSLGVVLYEMLTSQSPYRSKTETLQGLVRDVCELEPVKPSEHLRSLRGDLDNIVLMALRKDPQRRYTLASQLAEDIGRYLNGAPVQARGDAVLYIASKFVRRHWIATAAAGVMFVGLTAAGVVAYQAQSRAARRFNDVRTLANSMLFEVHDSIGKYPGTLEARRILVQRANQYLDALTQEDADPELLSELAAAYSRVASLTNDVALSIEIHKKARALSERLYRADPRNSAYARQLSESESWIGNQLRQLGDLAGASEHHRREIALVEDLARRDASAENRESLADAYGSLASILVRKGELRNAFELQNKAVALNETLAGEQPESDSRKRAVVISTLMRGVALSDLGDWKQAAAADQEGVRTASSLLAKDPHNQMYRRDVWLANEHLALVLEKGAQYREALAALELGLPHLEQLSQADPGDGGHLRGLALTYLAMGRMQAQLGRWAESQKAVEKAIAIARSQLAVGTNPHESRHDLARGCLQLGAIHLQARRLDLAERLFTESATHYKALSQRDPQNVIFWRENAELLSTWGALLVARQDWAGAAERYRGAQEKWDLVKRAGALRECDRNKVAAAELPQR